MEILSPAGNMESLKSAVAAGCQAVYLGCQAFSARAGAGNFSDDELKQAVAFAHLHHVRVYVTVNTLVKDKEMTEVGKLLSFINGAGVDAVLVQDLGVLQILRHCFPDLPIHASTQMTIHNYSGAVWCRKNGISRAVLARECSISEIALTSKAGIETEVFVHGAQCVSVSGQCLFSSQIGCRSGNRGRCAQPCRLMYSYMGKKGAWLSPRDVCMRDYMPEVMKAGVTSLKIEGRLKRPEYVAQVTMAYANAVRNLSEGRFAAADNKENQALQQIFNRGGFMSGGYAFGNQDAGVIYPEKPGHSGVKIGTVAWVKVPFAGVQLTEQLNDQDEIELENGTMIYSGNTVSAGNIARIRLRPGMDCRNGMDVRRLTDSTQIAAMGSIKPDPIPVAMHLRAMPGENLLLTVSDGESTVQAVGENVEEAQHRPMTTDDAATSLGKTGGTPFTVKSCHVDTENAFVPVKALNELRRQALDSMAASRSENFGRKSCRQVPFIKREPKQGKTPDVLVISDISLLPEAADTGCLVAWQPENYREEFLEREIQKADTPLWLALPTVCEENTLQQLAEFAKNHTERLSGVVLGSVGQLGVKWSVPVAAGMGIPVMNRMAAEFLLEEECLFVTASPELAESELIELMSLKMPIAVPAYGRQRLMLLHHCPARVAMGLSSGHESCSMCPNNAVGCLKGTCLTDRMGVSFPLRSLMLPEGCLVELMNSAVTDVVREISEKGWSMHISLAGENSLEAAEKCRMLKAGCWQRKADTTAGHYRRPVE